MVTRSELGALLNLEENLIPNGNPGRTNKNMVPTYITVHNTSNTDVGANADAHRKLVNRPQGYYYTLSSGRKVYLTWHYTVDDTKVVKHLKLSEQGLHASSSVGNRSSIGIEICMNSDIDQGVADLRAARLVAILRYDLGIANSRIKTHNDWNGKNCPILLLDDKEPGEKWKSFLNVVQREYESIE